MQEMPRVSCDVEDSWRRSTNICKVRFVSMQCSLCHVSGVCVGSIMVWGWRSKSPDAESRAGGDARKAVGLATRSLPQKAFGCA